MQKDGHLVSASIDDFNASLQYLHCYRTGDTAVLH